MKKVTEYVNLAKARVFYDGKGSYTFNFSKSYKMPNPYVFRGDHDAFVKFLMRIKAKDTKTYPNSVRGERYADIATEIENGTDPDIYLWEHDFMKYLNSSKKVKEATLLPRDFLAYIKSEPKWSLFDERPDVTIYSYRDKVFLDFNKEGDIITSIAVSLSNSVGDLHVEVDLTNLRKIDSTKGLLSLTTRAGDEINIFLR